MSDSTASALASGSQDLAALLGLFATDGIERNALASHLGWGSVVASSLSLLGILGLVKSSIKLALGLDYCSSAGFNLDSVRGIFGFLPGESAASGPLVHCDFAVVQISSQGMKITKSERYFSEATTPIVALGSNLPRPRNQILINLGNLRGETAFKQSLGLITLMLVVCSGLTTWLLEIVHARWNWVKIVAIPGLQMCLIMLLALPLWYDRQLNRPGSQLNVERWDGLHGDIPNHQMILNLLQVRRKDWDVLHFKGNTTFIETRVMKGSMLLLSAFAATSYLCQYSILKEASSKQALTWIGCQGALAAARLGYWVFNPSFDDPSVATWEVAELNVTGSNKITLSELICNTFAGKAWQMPGWALKYLTTTPLQDILHIAAWRKDTDLIPIDAEICPLFQLDFHRLILRRWVNPDDDAVEFFRMALYKPKNNNEDELIVPFVMTQMPYAERNNELEDDVHDECWVETVWPLGSRGNDQDRAGINVAWCTLVTMTENGRRLHLEYDRQIPCHENCPRKAMFDPVQGDRGFLGDRSRICKWLAKIADNSSFDRQCLGGWQTTVVIGGDIQRSKKRDGPVDLDYQRGIRKMREYIEKGIQSPQERDFRSRVRLWLRKKRNITAEKNKSEQQDRNV